MVCCSLVSDGRRCDRTVAFLYAAAVYSGTVSASMGPLAKASLGPLPPSLQPYLGRSRLPALTRQPAPEWASQFGL